MKSPLLALPATQYLQDLPRRFASVVTHLQNLSQRSTTQKAIDGTQQRAHAHLDVVKLTVEAIEHTCAQHVAQQRVTPTKQNCPMLALPPRTTAHALAANLPHFGSEQCTIMASRQSRVHGIQRIYGSPLTHCIHSTMHRSTREKKCFCFMVQNNQRF